MVVIFHNVWRYQITTLYTLNIYKLVDDTSHWEKENCWVSSSTPLSPNKENVEIKRTFYPEVEHACMLVARHLTPWTIAHQAPLSMGFSRQEYWSGWSYPPPGDLPHPGIEPTSLVSPALAGRFFTTVSLGKTLTLFNPLIHIIL